jgi:serine/threonine-protein kinase RsbW
VTEETTASAMAAVPSGSSPPTGSPVPAAGSVPAGSPVPAGNPAPAAGPMPSGGSVQPGGSSPLADPVPVAADGASTAVAPLMTARPLDVAADQVTVRMPADGAYLSVLRTATAGLAARLDFTLDDIEDMRIAVDEACAMLLSQAIPGSSLECNFALSPDDMTITVSVPCLNPRPPSGETFAWTVLSALASTVEAQVGPGDRLAIVMRKSRPNPGSV